MKRLIGLSVALCACLLAPLMAGAAGNTTITGDGVRLRAEPNTTSRVIASFSKGARVEVIFRSGTFQTIDGDTYYWYFVNAGNMSGYVYGRFITMDAAVAPSFDPVEPEGLDLPYEDPGACPFECCVYREWSVKADTPIHADRTDGSPVIFTVRAGEWVTGLTGVVIVTSPGRGVVTTSMKLGNRQASPGDLVEYLTYQGEGFYKAWFKGRFIDGINGFYDVVMTTEPASTWWVEVKDKNGRVGWTKEHKNFGHMDACAKD